MPENPANKTKNNASYAKKANNYTNPGNKSEFEPITQVKEDNVITEKNLLSPPLRNGLILIILAISFVATIYYGIINP
jgi:hypothetical protein